FSEAIEKATQESLKQEEPEKHSSRGKKGNSTPVIQSSGSSNQTVQRSDSGYGTDSSKPGPEIQSSSEPNYVEGYEMQKGSANATGSGGVSFSGSDVLGVSVVVLAVGGIYLGFFKKKI
ncbi:MAG: cobaltochelatase CobN, partial [Euryarchaeota archaeon]|nr:cobaltochelatase CobN [Euryarchaeota archaeon]